MPDLTITLTAAQATRVANALGSHLRLSTVVVDENLNTTHVPRAATMDEAKDFLINVLKSIVVQEERKAVVIPEL